MGTCGKAHRVFSVLRETWSVVILVVLMMEMEMFAIRIGKGIELNIDRARFTPEVNEYIFRYGLKQMLADANATIKRDSSEDWQAKSRALTEKKLASLYAGEVHQQSDRVNGVEGEARRMALAAIQTKIRDQGKSLKLFSNDQIAAMVTANFPKYMAAAEKIVAMRAQNDVEIDLGALGL